MSLSQLSRQIRSLLDDDTPDTPLPEVLNSIDDFILACTASSEPEIGIYKLEEELQVICDELLDHSSVTTISSFLAVLYRLEPLLSSTSIISTWFDLVLRPSLREPRLPPPALKQAKNLVLSALDTTKDHFYSDKMADFRRRLVDYYLLDVFNDGSGEDMLEWADLSDAQREVRMRWKSNLEDVLLTYGKRRPEDLMTEINDHFMTPSSRLQLLKFLDIFITECNPETLTPILAQHPLLQSILSSLLLDGSTTTCTVGLTFLVKLVPLFAVHSREFLLLQLSYLFVILQRILCWKQSPLHMAAGESHDASLEEMMDAELNPELALREDLTWERLRNTFSGKAASSVPEVRPLFTILYYLFPCNLLNFLRQPLAYIIQSELDCPYACGWDQAIDEPEIRSKSESLVRTHSCHASLIATTAVAELTGPTFWQKYDAAKICTEARMLDVRRMALAVKERYSSGEPLREEAPVSTNTSSPLEPTSISTLDHAELSPGCVRISLEKILAVSAALRSNIDVEVVEPTSQWTATLLSTQRQGSETPMKAAVSLPEEEGQEIPPRILDMLALLMREVLLLRNELNFELWVSRENCKHVGRIFEDRLVSKRAETERQGLYNKLRRYRTDVVNLERELKDHKDKAASNKSKYEDWTTELHEKLKNFRKEKDGWMKESASLRTQATESQAMFEAQKTLLANATKELFELQTQRREVQHKIDRLRDYEKQIEQHVKIQSLWDEDFARFNDREAEMKELQGQLKQMFLRLQSYEQTSKDLEDQGRRYRRQIQSLEARLSEVSVHHPAHHHDEFALVVSQKAELTENNKKLREQHGDLIDEVEELRAMVEVLRGQVAGSGLLIHESMRSTEVSTSPQSV